MDDLRLLQLRPSICVQHISEITYMSQAILKAYKVKVAPLRSSGNQAVPDSS